ncbi:MAG: hypothetical protein ABJE95_13170 [Byssovorax sp.]
MVSGSETCVRLSRGELREDADGSLRVTIPIVPEERRRVKSFFDRLASFGERHGEAALLLSPTTIAEREGTLTLTYASADAVGFGVAGRVWREDLAARLPTALAVCRAIVGAGLALERAGWGLSPLTPAQIRIARAACDEGSSPGLDPRGLVRLIALPPLAVSLDAWAGADPAAWAWASPEALLGDLDAGTGYAAGALVHACIVEDLWPERIPPAERFQRLLRGRSGSLPRVTAALAAALPKSCGIDALELVETVGLLLDADRSRRPSGDEITARIDRLCERITPGELAAGWEREGQAQRAIDVLVRGASATKAAEVAWGSLARLAEAQGDLARAIESAARGLPRGDAGELRAYVALLGRIAALGPAREALLARGIELLDAAIAGDPGDATRVYLAHLEARHLGRGDAARSRLKARLESQWCRALGAAIEARAYLEAEQFPHGSRATRDGRALLDAAPDGGGRTGSYLRAYLHLLDGIANFGAVRTLGDPSYLRDAFGGFTQSLNLARSITATDLVDANVHWLAHLNDAARPDRTGASEALTLGIDAYLEAHGLVGAVRDPRLDAAPGIPWYDEATLFPAQVVTP